MTGGATSLRRDATWLTGGSLLAGVAAYLFLAMGTRLLGDELFAPIGVLWSLWAVSAASITFPLQHWIIRTVEAEGSEAAVRSRVPRISAWTLLLTAVLGAVVSVAHESLFGVSDPAFVVMTLLLPWGSVLMGLVRGLLASRGQFAATAGAILGENVIRVGALAIIQARAGSAGAGWAVMSGFLIAIAFLGVLRAARQPGTRPPSGPGRLGALAVGNALSHTVLTSAPVVLSLLGGRPRDVTAVFTALAVLRVPYMLLVGLSNRLTGPLTRRALEQPTWVAALSGRAAGATVLVAVIGAGAGAFVLPPLTVLVFGGGHSLTRLTAALLTGGSIVAVGNLVQMLVLIARHRGQVLAEAWLVGLVPAVLALATSLDLPTRIAASFLVAEATALAWMSARDRLDRQDRS